MSSASAGIPGFNATDNSTGVEDDVGTSLPWYVILEAAVLVCVGLMGLAENAIVIRNSVIITRNMKQNVIMFCSLAITDLGICLFRIPCHIYILLQQSWVGDSGHVVCQLWSVSTILIVVAIFTNLVIGLQRLLIIYSFPSYRKYFTIKKVSILSASMWLALTAVCLGIYNALGSHTDIVGVHRTCAVWRFSMISDVSKHLLVRIIMTSVLGLIPILVTTVCYVMIIVKVYESGLIGLDRLDDRASYTRATHIAITRAAVLLFLWTPFLLFVIIAPEFPEMTYPVMRYLDYLLCAQSTITPFITMQDSDFKETFSRRRWLTRHCAGTQRDSSVLRKGTGRGRRSKHSYVTSAEMKTFKHTE